MPCSHCLSSMHARTHAKEPGVIKELEGESRHSPSGPPGLFMKGMEMRVKSFISTAVSTLRMGEPVADDSGSVQRIPPRQHHRPLIY